MQLNLKPSETIIMINSTNEVKMDESKNSDYLIKSIKFKAFITTLRAFMSPAETTKNFEITFVVDSESTVKILKEKLANNSLVILGKAVSFCTSDLAKTLNSISLLADFLPKGSTEASLKAELTQLAKTLSHNESVELIKDEQKLENITPSQIMPSITTTPKEEPHQIKESTITHDHYQPMETLQTSDNGFSPPQQAYVVQQEIPQTDQAISRAIKRVRKMTKLLKLNEDQKQNETKLSYNRMKIQDGKKSEDVIVTGKDITEKNSTDDVEKQSTTSILQKLEITPNLAKRLEIISQHIYPEPTPVLSKQQEDDFANAFSSHPANSAPSDFSTEFGYQASKQKNSEMKMEMEIDSMTKIAEGVPQQLVETIKNSKVEKTYDETATEKAREQQLEMHATVSRFGKHN